MTKEFVCKDCEHIGEVKSGKRGNFVVSTLLWTLIIPGIFYSIWRMTGKNKCKSCGGSHLTSLDSEYGKYVLEKFYMRNLLPGSTKISAQKTKLNWKIKDDP